MSFTLNEKKVSLLGFSTAGWQEYEKALEKDGVEVYTSSTRILDSKESIYQQTHDYQTLKKKAGNKKKSPSSVQQALQHVLNILNEIQEPDTRKEIINLIQRTCCLDEEDMGEDITAAINDNTEMIKYCITLMENEGIGPDPTPNNLQGLSINLTGYNFVRALSSLDYLKNKDLSLKDKLEEWISYVNLNTSSIDTQKILANSKSVVSDTLQTNLELFKKGQALVPIHFIIASENGFNLNTAPIINKVGDAYTNAELRIAYKLTEEIDNPLIHEIMKKTVFFIKQTKNGFEKIPPPWGNEEEKIWIDRKRSKNKLAYKKRAPNEIPDWIKQLCKLADEAKKSKEAKEDNVAHKIKP